MNHTFLRICFWFAFFLLTVGPLSTRVWGQEKTDRNDDPLPKYAEISALAVSPDGKTLASTSYEGIDIWDLATRKKKSRFPDDLLYYCSLAFSDEGRTLITVDPQGHLRYRESTSGKILHEFALTKDADEWEYETCSMTRNGRFLALRNSTSKTVCVWDLTARKEVARIKSAAYPIGISEDGRYLARERERHGLLEVWDIPNSKTVRSFEVDEPCYLNKLGFSPDGKTLMSYGSHHHGTRSWDIGTGKLRMAYGRGPRETYEFTFSNDGKRLATLHEDEKGWGLSVWDFAAGKQLWRRPMVWFVGQALVFTPDGNTLITAGNGPDANIRLWDVCNGTEKQTR
jgi:WD40 repeat protein